MPGSARPALERRGSFAGLFCDEDVETVGADLDAEHRGPRCAGAVGGVGEQVAETGEPEQAVGPGVVAELELEVGERAVRGGEGDAPAGGSRSSGGAAGDRGRRRVPMAARPKMPAPMARVPMSSPCPPT